MYVRRRSHIIPHPLPLGPWTLCLCFCLCSLRLKLKLALGRYPWPGMSCAFQGRWCQRQRSVLREGELISFQVPYLKLWSTPGSRSRSRPLRALPAQTTASAKTNRRGQGEIGRFQALLSPTGNLANCFPRSPRRDATVL
ncbi:hypothetical protein J3E69DRAFT_338253 [Trichoderma sp. SZMC 28015]